MYIKLTYNKLDRLLFANNKSNCPLGTLSELEIPTAVMSGGFGSGFMESCGGPGKDVDGPFRVEDEVGNSLSHDGRLVVPFVRPSR